MNAIINIKFIKSKLFIKFLLWFLIIALMPVAFLGYSSYKKAREIIEYEVLNNLSFIAEECVRDIGSFLHEKEINVSIQAENPIVIDAMEEMVRLFETDGINSKSYRLAEEEIFSYLSFIKEKQSYYDVLFISPGGDVVFTVEKESDLGRSVLSDAYIDTEVGKVFNSTLAQQAACFSSFQIYEPSGIPSAFVAARVHRDDFLLGVLVFQLDAEMINELASNYIGLGETGETVIAILDGDFAMVTVPLRHDPSAAFNMKIKMGSEDALPIQEAVRGNSGSGISVDYRGAEILSVWRYIPTLNWGLVVKVDTEEEFAVARSFLKRILMLSGFIFIFVLAISMFVTRLIANPIVSLSTAASQVSEGNLQVQLAPSKGRDEIGDLSNSFNVMVGSLRTARDATQREDWLKTGIARLNEKMGGDLNIADLSTNVVSEVTTYVGAQVGAMYLMDEGAEEEPILSLMGAYAYKKRKNLSNQYKPGEGLVGQAALEKQQILIRNVPEDYIKVTSGLGEATPQFISVTPFLHETRVKGVVEIGSLHEITDLQMEYLSQAMSAVGINVQTAQSRDELAQALQRSQSLNEELQTQQEELQTANEELQTANEELETQTERLRASEEELRAQQEELQTANEDLEEKTQFLEDQKDEISGKNRDLEKIRTDLEQKAKELEITSRYKSEFLANMSHELRTPLNSLLILSQDMAYDKEQNLTKEQVESAEIIHSSGVDLLKLIDEILDLSKIEAGKMTAEIEEVRFADLVESINANFKHVATEKDLILSVEIDDNLPKDIKTDRQKLEQVIKNLMSNAIKFTDAGSITVDIHRPASDLDMSHSGLDPRRTIAISVIDTGIGIPEDKQLDIFEAFQQIDGSTSRKYGGTGLGLSISRELAKLLGGEIQLDSKENEGSVFTVYIPEEWNEAVDQHVETRQTEDGESTFKAKVARRKRPAPSPMIEDDRKNIENDDRVILVIEDDIKFAKVLYNFCKDRNFKLIHAGDGETGLEYATKYNPDAIVLDIRLPGIEGWTVLEVLKENVKTRHIPVHMMSVEEETIDAYKKGAIGYLTKPIDKKQLEEAFQKMEYLISRDFKSLLLVEDDENLKKSIMKLIGNTDVKIKAVELGKDAINELKEGKYDCMILDLKLPDMSGFEVLRILDEMEGIPIPPIIVHTGRDLTRGEEFKLQEYADSIIIKGAKSQERLLDETAMFLHRVVGDLPDFKQKMISKLHDKETLFEGKKIMLVDDDMRNVFAVSKILRDKGMVVFKAADGKIALDVLDRNPEIDLVLMDIMMPVMDGYEATRQIRLDARFRALPILAVTAKAMKKDRQKCIEAGANDYIAKPLDIDKLLSLMRVWLYK